MIVTLSLSVCTRKCTCTQKHIGNQKFATTPLTFQGAAYLRFVQYRRKGEAKHESIDYFFGVNTIFVSGGPWISNPIIELDDVTPTTGLTFHLLLTAY